MSTEAIQTQMVVIGGGPAGYPAAFYAADKGLNVTLVDAAENPGGVCLYRGCIPSKALLHAAEIIRQAKEAEAFGLTFQEPELDVDKLRAWKDAVVGGLTGGLGSLCKARGVTYLQGRGTFKDATTLEVAGASGATTVTFEHAIVATGSIPVSIPLFPESPRVLDSTGALELPDIPGRLLVVGGGYIGLELGQAYSAFGSAVSVVEMLPSLLPGADKDLADVLARQLKKQFESIMVSTKVTKVTETGDALEVEFEGKDGKAFSETYDRVLVAIGRRPVTAGLGLENTGVKVLDNGFIEINKQQQTAEAGIYAIGDVAGQPMLAHKATHEAKVAVDAAMGLKTVFDAQAIPAVMFTDPEIAWCGLTEGEAKAAGRTVKVAKFPWAASGRAKTLGRHDGFTKLIVDPDTERILGVGVVGPHAGELIAEGVLAIEMGAVVEDIALTIHPHPTLSETMMEAAEVYHGHSPHFFKK